MIILGIKTHKVHGKGKLYEGMLKDETKVLHSDYLGQH